VTKKNNQGFTLIELLIVIVLIGILSGVLLSVIKPGAQRQKANETVMMSNMNKILMAVKACTSTSKNPYTACRTFTGVSANDPSGEPVTGTVYGISADTSPYLLIRACLGGTYGTSPCGTSACQIQYRYDTSTGITDVTNSGGCLIDIPAKI